MNHNPRPRSSVSSRCPPFAAQPCCSPPCAPQPRLAPRCCPPCATQPRPTHPYCPCCVNDLIELRNEVKKTRGVLACHIEVVGIPQANRWTAAINE